jgi:hypothetical protein
MNMINGQRDGQYNDYTRHWNIGFTLPVQTGTGTGTGIGIILFTTASKLDWA